jgi:hypothetical protein
MKLEERYALAETGSGALLLDLGSGIVFQLNKSSEFIWQLALGGQTEETIAAELVRRHALDLETAVAHVHRTLNPSRADIAEPPPTAFLYERRGAEYLFRFRGESAFLIDDRGERIVPAGSPIDTSLDYLLQAIAPKLLSLRGHVVLHASAVAIDNRVVAFSGDSRAGKTTTARTFASAGAELVCEDKLLIQAVGGQTRATRFGERAVEAWVASAAEALRASKLATCSGLDGAIEGETLPLVEIGFLDAQRRTSGAYAAAALSQTETAGAVFRHGFYGSDASHNWIRHLRTAAHVGRTVRGFDLSMPNGLDRLAAAVTPLVHGSSLESDQ